MNKSILIVRNVTREGPGLLEEVLHERGISWTNVDLDAGDTLPAVEKFSAVVVLGGPDSANDQTPKMLSELAAIREIIRRNIPYLGICLGLQTLVKAAGGNVVRNPVKEIGFRDPENNRFTVELTESGKRDPLFAGLGAAFNVFHLHGETVVLPETMELLATGKFCRNQIAKLGNRAYGIQCHFELTPAMFEDWLAEDADLQTVDARQLRRDFEDSLDNYTNTGRALLQNFLNIAGC